MTTLQASLSMLRNPALIQYLLRGVMFTLIISLIAVLAGIVIGSVLALVRNYATRGRARIFRRLSIIYIEVFRNTPLLLWIFICMVFCPTPAFLNRKMFGLTSSADVKLLFKASVALILFTSSVIAEIIRGGLNSVAEGSLRPGAPRASAQCRSCATSSCPRPSAT